MSSARGTVQTRGKGRVADVRTHLLSRVVLHLELDARALAGDEAPANDAALDPYLAVLADNDALGIRAIEAFVRDLDDVDVGLVRDELILALPRDADGRADLVADAREPRAEGDRGRGGWRDGEAEEEGGEAAAGGVVVRGECGLACERVGEDSVGRRQARALEEPACVQEGGGGRVIPRGELCADGGSDAHGFTGGRRTFNGDELDEDETDAEASVRPALHLHLPGDRAACDEALVGERERNVDLGVVRRGVHGLWPRLESHSCVRGYLECVDNKDRERATDYRHGWWTLAMD